MVELPAPVRSAMATPRANTWTGLGLVVAAVGLFPVFRALAGVLPSTLLRSAVGMTVAGVVMPSLVLVGIVFLLQPARQGLTRAAVWGLAIYVSIGIVLVATGIPGYVDPGSWYLAPFWPSFVVWLHECTLGFGLWPCPPG